MNTMLIVVAAIAGFGFSAIPKQDESAQQYKERITKWRQAQEEDLKKPEGWLNVAGLYWLKDGDNTIGSGASNSIVLGKDSAPDQVGTLNMSGSSVTFTAASRTAATIQGNPVTSQKLRLDGDRVTVGSLRFVVIRRGARTGVRVFDPNCEGRKAFKGEKWYPVDPKFVVHAKYTEYDTPKSMSITNIIGDTADVSNPGYVTFTIGDKECRLEAQSQGGGLFFNFRDATSGKSTYPAGRFLDAAAPVHGMVTLDFNQATNPPCAFTSFATCPLPPSSNFLTVAIPAGEKTHHPPEKK